MQTAAGIPEPGVTLSPGAATVRPRLNSTGRDISLTVPVTDGSAFLGDIALVVLQDDSIALPPARLLDLLSAVINPDVIVTLRRSFGGQPSVGLNALRLAEIEMHYDPLHIELALDIPARLRQTLSLPLTPLSRDRLGEYAKPAGLSAYLNIHGAIDYVEKGANRGFAAPVLALDAATRFKGVVLEAEGSLQPGAEGSDFQRQGTRFVYDDEKELLRWSVGDLRTTGRGFQSSPEMAGISVFRSYGALQPQTISRPTGRQSFRLERTSTVEITVNDRVVRRVRLEPGGYDLRDFPVTQGIDNVRVSIQDDSGRTEVLQFNLFFDQTQLAEGLKEFGLYAGVKAPLGRSGPVYTREGAISGYYRQGISDRLTLGTNLQADTHSAMAGMESILSTAIGAFGVNFAASRIDSLGSGVASIFTYQSMSRGKDAKWDAINLSAESWSKNFGPSGTLASRNPYLFRLGGSYSHAFNDAVYAGVDLRYAKGRDTLPDSHIYRALLGWRPTPTINLGAELTFQNPTATGQRDIALRLTLTLWLDSRSGVTADFDSRQRTTRLGYQTIHGEGVGSYNAAAALERTSENFGVNASMNYLASAAELGIDHLATFGSTSGLPGDSHTILRFGTSAALTDGAFSAGRPIYDSFAIVVRNKSLGGASVFLDPTPNGYTAATTLLGTATAPNLSSYSDRTITIDAPLAVAGVDLGSGAFRVFPPYRSGYRLEVGSDFSVSLIGRLLDAEGMPLALIAGTAIEALPTGRPAVELFTNRSGRFGITGARPGHWRIVMQTEPETTYRIVVPPGTSGVIQVGDLKPEITESWP